MLLTRAPRLLALNRLQGFLSSTLTDFQISIRNYTPRRAVLYVPGNDSKKVKKALALDVDCIVLDCEDGVALNQKSQARQNIRAILDKGKPKKKRRYDLAVRVNPPDGSLWQEDLKVILGGKNFPDTFLLPKVHTPDQVKLFADAVQPLPGPKGVVLMIESALALVNIVDICKTAVAEKNKIKPVALLFGSDDFCASIGATRDDSLSHLSYARQKLVTVAKAFDLQTIDAVYIKYQDPEGFEKQALDGARLGFTGKQVIHPDQVGIAQKVFMPSNEHIEWATKILESFHKHQKEGKGAFSYNGQMIDMPTVRQAQNIVDLVNAIMMQDTR